MFVAELAVDLDLFSLIDHILDLFSSDADDRLLHSGTLTVAVELHRHLL